VRLPFKKPFHSQLLHLPLFFCVYFSVAADGCLHIMKRLWAVFLIRIVIICYAENANRWLTFCCVLYLSSWLVSGARSKFIQSSYLLSTFIFTSIETLSKYWTLDLAEDSGGQNTSESTRTLQSLRNWAWFQCEVTRGRILTLIVCSWQWIVSFMFFFNKVGVLSRAARIFGIMLWAFVWNHISVKFLLCKLRTCTN
jgi:hypothetical protein